MLYLSRGRSPSLLMVPGFEEIVQTIHGNIPQVKKPVWLKFTPMDMGFEAPGLPTQWDSGKAYGYLETEHAALQSGMEEAEVISFLNDHASYGVDFIGVNEEGKEVMSADDGIFVPEGEGGFFCKICQIHLANAQGLSGHKRSKAHSEAFEVALSAARGKLTSNL